MEQRKTKRIKEYLIAAASFGVITLAFYVFLYKEFDLIYGINDDWTLYMVISGSYLGTPEPRVTYMLFPLAWLLSKLYGITTAVPWYGMMLHGSIALCGAAVFFGTYLRCKNFIRKILIGSILLVLFYISNIRMMVAIQYTQVAAMCGASAIFWFLIADTKEKGWKEYLLQNIPTIVLATLSLNIRENAAYMCLPVAGMVFLGKWYLEDKKITGKVILKYSGLLAMLLITVGGTILCHKIAYSAPEWKEYIEVNNIWTECVDYYGFPSYKEMEEMVTQNGMTEEDYQISMWYQTFYNGEMPYVDFIRLVAEKAKENYEKENPFSVKLQNANSAIITYFTHGDIRPQNTIAVWLFVLVLVGMIFRKDKSAFVILACYVFGRFYAWYFLLFAGRFPLRIPQGLFMQDILVLVGLILYFDLWGSREYANNKILTLAAYGVSAVILCLLVKDGLHQLDLFDDYVYIYQDRWYGLKEYCAAHPENEYVLTTGSQTLFYYSDDIWETESIGKKQNYYLNSNFDSPSPNYYNRLGISKEEDMAEKIIERENSYWIFEQGTFSEGHPMVVYYSYRYDTFDYEIVDTFSTDSTVFEVYQIRK